MYLPLTYTLVEVDAAIAPDREATTIAVAIASLLNIGRSPFAGEPLWPSHANNFAAAAQRLHVGILVAAFGSSL
jgi:hypothetical protein